MFYKPLSGAVDTLSLNSTTYTCCRVVNTGIKVAKFVLSQLVIQHAVSIKYIYLICKELVYF